VSFIYEKGVSFGGPYADKEDSVQIVIFANPEEQPDKFKERVVDLGDKLREVLNRKVILAEFRKNGLVTVQGEIRD